MKKKNSKPILVSRLHEFNSQLKDLRPLAERNDPALSSWEIQFIMDRIARKFAVRNATNTGFVPTEEQANKLNQIYENKYLRGIYH